MGKDQLEMNHGPSGSVSGDIAIVGMAAHLPGAPDIGTYWQNLRAGLSAIKPLDKATLLANGESPEKLGDPNYVPYAAALDDFDHFDAEFFGFSPKDAAIMDPQHRQFLEVAWEALENAGHVPETFDGSIGAFGGCGMGSYFYFNLCSNRDLVDDVGMFLLRHTGNDKDFLTTRLSHAFDLKGPSLGIQTACSTSLVATHFAAQALLNGECDMALAGGVTVELPHARGYIFAEGEILSPDGQCHAFDHRAKGTVFGSGAGMVVLRRLEDALADGDHIWAVLKGSAVNNDGAEKAGYLAPSVAGQAQAIGEAIAVAGVSADQIGYVECHGTGTYLGDPIEVAALTAAFRETTADVGFCGIGSVKTNIGHLDTAAGAASIIKTALSVYHGEKPPSLSYEAPNPAIDFAGSPFQVNAALSPFDAGKPRIAGVNSLGVGGTNAHVILSEPPQRVASDEVDWPFLPLVISGHNEAALAENAERLAAHMEANPELNLADVAYTLQVGRKAFAHRMTLVAGDTVEAAARLREHDPARVFRHKALDGKPRVCLLFPGGGAQYADMARDLYETEPVFRDVADEGLAILKQKSGVDYAPLWFSGEATAKEVGEEMKRPSVQLPLLTLVEVATARLLESWGVHADMALGHSMGENAAACVAGVMSFEDCLGLVLLRGQLFEEVEAGGMLSVPLSASETIEIVGKGVDIAAENSADLSVLSGPKAALTKARKALEKSGVECVEIPINIAAHSRLLDPILPRFRAYLESITLNKPDLPFLSNSTGEFITDQMAMDPEYWVSHLRNSVRFGACAARLAAEEDVIFIEVGPGKILGSMLSLCPEIPRGRYVNALRHGAEKVEDDQTFMTALLRVWALGGAMDWQTIWGDGRRLRLPLPGYAFQKTRYFIEPGKARLDDDGLERLDEAADFASAMVWKPEYADCAVDLDRLDGWAQKQRWLIMLDQAGLGEATAKRLEASGQSVLRVSAGDTFENRGQGRFSLAPEQGLPGYQALIHDLVAEGTPPDHILCFWPVTTGADHRAGSSSFHRNQEQGFYALLFLAQAIEAENLPLPLRLTVVGNGVFDAKGSGVASPEKATLLGAVGVIPREMAGLSLAFVDVELAQKKRRAPSGREGIATHVLEAALAENHGGLSAIRGDVRYVPVSRAVPSASEPAARIKRCGAYAITGGFSEIGLVIAERLAREYHARIALISRTELPDRADWPQYLRLASANDPLARKIRAVVGLEKAGGTIVTVVADVCNPDEMNRAKAGIEAAFGSLNGLIHAAGTINDGPLLAKTQPEIEDVLAPKVQGTLVLDQVFPDGSLDWMVLFSSTSTTTTPAGQIDYAAANAFLNAFAQSRALGETKVIALNWGIWAEVGMAARSLGGGQRHVETSIEPVRQPLLQARTKDAEGHRVFDATIHGSDWVVDEHRLPDGSAILPGTGYLELLAEAWSAQGETRNLEMRDVYFLSPLKVADTGAKLRLRLKRGPEGYEAAVFSTLEGAREEAHLDAVLAPFDGKAASVDLDEIRARMGQVETAGDVPLKAAQDGQVLFGPRWQVLSQTALGDKEGLARLRLPLEFRSDLKAGFALHPALMDIATGWAMLLIPGYRPDTLWMPFGYGNLRQFSALGAEVESWVRLTSVSEDSATFDVTITDPAGSVLVEIKEFAIRKARALRSSAVFQNDTKAASELDGPTAKRLRRMVSLGITTAEGAECFMQALVLGLPQVTMSSIPVPALLRAVATDPSDAAKPIGFERPASSGECVAPEGPVETTLVGFWKDLLGVSEIGVTDSFFDLGGHSLIAVRLFSMIRKTYGATFPMSVLFEAPTIRACAALIVETTGLTQDDEGGVAPQAAKPRFRHLVAMHDGEGGAKRPFFLVAGMFGNVLNLRHLAHLIGADRPFYGLQARGLLGEDLPHDSIEAAARDYIAEMKDVQAEGPYLIGGFSGGGVTAFEIARQLEEAGDEVAQLVMLDTPLPLRRPLTRKDRWLIQMQEIRRNGPLYPAQWLKNRLTWEISKRFGQAESEQAGGFHSVEIGDAFLTAVQAYRPTTWDGNLTLFRPPLVGKWEVSDGQLVSHERSYLTDDNDWRHFVPGLIVQEVPGDHDSMVLEPNVRVLADRMRRLLETSEATWAARKGHSKPAFLEAAE